MPASTRSLPSRPVRTATLLPEPSQPVDLDRRCGRVLQIALHLDQQGTALAHWDWCRIGLETGPTPTWLWTELKTRGFPVICIELGIGSARLRWVALPKSAVCRRLSSRPTTPAASSLSASCAGSPAHSCAQ